MLDPHMGDHHRLIVSIVNRRLENLNALLGIKRTSREANQLLGLARKHAPADNR